MRRLLFLLCICCCSMSFAQSEDPKPMTEEQRVALTPVVMDATIPASAAKQLMNKMQQIVLKSGCASIGNGRYVIACSIDELTKDVTSTAPLMYAYTLNFNFFISDSVEGTVYASTSIEARGVGENDTKAYLAALKTIQPNNPAFKPFVEKGRKQIVQMMQTEEIEQVSDTTAN